MNNGYITEHLEALLESLESDESDEMDEWAEAKKKPKYSKPKTGSGNVYAPKPSSAYVTEARLEAAMARVGAQIKTNSDAIGAVNAKVNPIIADLARVTTAIKKESEERKKDINALRSNVQMAALLPMLNKPTTRTINQNVQGTELEANDKVLVDKGDSLSALLPMLLLGGMGSSSDSSASGASGSNDSSMMLVLALALSQNNNKK